MTLHQVLHWVTWLSLVLQVKRLWRHRGPSSWLRAAEERITLHALAPGSSSYRRSRAHVFRNSFKGLSTVLSLCQHSVDSAFRRENAVIGVWSILPAV